MYCRFCGTKLEEDEQVCPNCGKRVDEPYENPTAKQEEASKNKIKYDEDKVFPQENIYDKSRYSFEPDYHNIQPEKPIDTGSFGWAILGFFFPLVGFILFLIWRKDKPTSAKHAGIGTLIGFILWIILSIMIICCCSSIDWNEINQQIKNGNYAMTYKYA